MLHCKTVVTNSPRLPAWSKWPIGALAVRPLTLASFTCLLLVGCSSDPDPGIEVVIENGSSIPVHDAHLWMKNEIRDIPIILPGHSASVTIHPPGESNLEFEFRKGNDDWRHCLFMEYAESRTFAIRIDSEGTCIEPNLNLPYAILTRPYTIPLAPPGSTSPPPWSNPQDQINLSGRFKVINAEHAPAKGSATAAVTVVEYGDFGDPQCAKHAHVAQQLLAAYPRDVRVVFKHVPISKASWVAHEAALAAGDQGKFWQMHDLLFADQGKLTREDMIGRAKQMKLDLPRFKRDLDSHRFKPVVDADQKELPAPELFIGRYYVVSGAEGLADFKRVVDFVIKETAAPHAEGR
jgi:hypothetical protein